MLILRTQRGQSPSLINQFDFKTDGGELLGQHKKGNLAIFTEPSNKTFS